MKTRNSIVVLGVGGLLAISLTGCAGGPGQDDLLEGTWQSRDTGGEFTYAPLPRLTFLEDGSFVGDDGCGPVTGSWSLEGGELSFSQTEAAPENAGCPDQESWLYEAVTGELAREQNIEAILVYDEQGERIGALIHENGATDTTTPAPTIAPLEP